MFQTSNKRGINDRLKNDSSQAERRAVLKNERETSTFFAQAQIGLSLEGGRFAQEVHFSGSAPSVEYPRLPASSPWASDPVPPEEPTGVAVDALEPCGTAAEIAASLGGGHKLAASTAPAVIPGSELAVGAALPSADDETGAAIPREAHARLQELIPKMIRRRKL